MSRADDALTRLTYIIPAAARPGGASLKELASTLEVGPDKILADVAAAADRDYYHPGGWVSDLVILASSDRLEVDRAGAFPRPGKLNRREALCLSLGLRSVGAASFASEAARENLLRRADVLAAGKAAEDAAAHLEIADDRGDENGIEECVLRCIRERRVCRIHYPTDNEDDGRRTVIARDIEPCVMARSEGHWHALSWCRLRRDPRAFRVDRITHASETPETFTVRADFDADAWLVQRRVYQPREQASVHVHYGPAVARWAHEEAKHRDLPVEHLEDGSIIVEYEVSDWRWAVRHVLRYGADAEIIAPPVMRERMLGVLERIGAKRDPPALPV